MRRSNDVFFFTLVDFLLQVVFFGLVVLTIQKVRDQRGAGRRANDEELAQQALKIAGVSSLAELPDALGTMVAASKAHLAEAEGAGGLAGMKRLQGLADSAGGLDSLSAIVRRYRTGQDGYGKPPCVYRHEGTRRVASLVGTVVGTDSTLEFERRTPELDAMLALLGVQYDDVRVLRPAAFRQTFGRLTRLRADCEYWLGFRERTEKVHAHNAAISAFHVQYLRLDGRDGR